MAYDLPAFTADLTAILTDRGMAGLDEIAVKLGDLLRNPAFVAATFDENSPLKRELFHDPATGVYVLAHVQIPGKRGMPHSHGASWAIYGNARGATEMTEWRQLNAEGDEHKELAAADRYTLTPGTTRAYPPNKIHSTYHEEKAWVVRVTGTDLDTLPRYHFRPRIDSMVDTAAAS